MCKLSRWACVRHGLICGFMLAAPHRYRSLLLLLIAMLVMVGGMERATAQRKRQPKRTPAAAVKSSAAQRKTSKVTATRRRAGTSKVQPSTRRRRTAPASRRRTRTRIRTTHMTMLNVISDRELSPGVRYTEYRSNGGSSVNVHVVIMDRTVTGNAVRLIKGEDRHDGLERIADMVSRYERETSNNVLALVNANFWRAYRSTVIGPCVIDGEIVEMLPYKKWSSAFFDFDQQMHVDTFRISGAMRINGEILAVQSVNRRVDSTGICVYNSFAGGTVPHVHDRELEKAFQEALKDTVFTATDSTEEALSKEQLRLEIARARREADQEFALTKVRLRYLRAPSINVPFPCQVIDTDTGTVDVPLRGCVVSFPKGVLARQPKPGDTVMMQFKTNIHTDRRFMNAVCGTPRLVRNGVAQHEAEAEGSTGRRFIMHNLARTAIGTDRSGNKLIIAAIEPTMSSDQTMGASLRQVAEVMKLLGAYQAMNLDGGGSAGMVVQNDHVFFDGQDPLTRRISVGLGVVKRSHVLRRTPVTGRTD
ncbi:MAG: phosphodiester glycosidase family protein [Candidatus Kapabacteria bacterium]|nr:phosphodiester glycosidase family protein [Candidatus Kapabacteria bacterium]